MSGLIDGGVEKDSLRSGTTLFTGHEHVHDEWLEATHEYMTLAVQDGFYSPCA